jgi:hypothetical protein
MARPGRRRLAVGTAATLLVAGLAGCGGDDDRAAGAPGDAAAAAFCAELEDAPGSDASAEDYHDYAGRLETVGTPAQIDGAARQGFELFVDYLADLDDGDVAKVKDSDEPSDVFSGDDAAKVESFKQGYVVTCGDPTTGSPTGNPTGSPTGSPTGGVLSSLSD